jgi:hypothetical protein
VGYGREILRTLPPDNTYSDSNTYPNAVHWQMLTDSTASSYPASTPIAITWVESIVGFQSNL